MYSPILVLRRMACALVEMNHLLIFLHRGFKTAAAIITFGGTCRHLAFNALILASTTLAVQVGMLLEEMERLGTKGEDGKVSIPPITTLEPTSLDALLPLLELMHPYGHPPSSSRLTPDLRDFNSHQIRCKFGALIKDDRCSNLFEAIVGTLRAAKVYTINKLNPKP